jgi:hypothetical protein
LWAKVSPDGLFNNRFQPQMHVSGVTLKEIFIIGRPSFAVTPASPRDVG